MQNLDDLTERAIKHPALSNKFYDLWICHPLNEKQISIFAFNYWFFTNNFPKALASLIAHTNDPMMRYEYVKTLCSEMGNGNPNCIHSLLFEKFYDELAKNFKQESEITMKSLEKKLAPLPSTISFVEKQFDLYSNNYAMAVGAQLALEWQAYSMIAQLYEGARNYRALWVNDIAFHESCEFFYIHIGSAEKEHKKESLNAAKKIEKTDYQHIETGFHTHLNLIENFWNGIANAIQQTT